MQELKSLERLRAAEKKALGRFARFGQNASILVRLLHSTNSPTRTTADPAWFCTENRRHGAVPLIAISF